MNYSKLTPEQALAAKAGLDLDVFVFEYVFEGEIDGVRNIPSFSKRADASQMLLIKIMAEYQDPGFEIRLAWGTDYFNIAVHDGDVKDGKLVPVWRVSSPRFAGHGLSFHEALCKLAIRLEKFRRSLAGAA